MIKSKHTIIIHTILPLLLGVLVYAVFRKDSIFYLKNNITFSNNLTTKFIRNHLCDALWAYSLTSALLVFTSISSKFIATIAILFFLLQEYITGKYFNQTFDWVDVIVMSFFALLSITLVKRNNLDF